MDEGKTPFRYGAIGCGVERPGGATINGANAVNKRMIENKSICFLAFNKRYIGLIFALVFSHLGQHLEPK